MPKECRFISFVISFCIVFSSFASPTLAWVNNTSNGSTAIGIGLLDRVEVGAPEGDYFGIGTVQIAWRDLEPIEGQFNWGLLKPEWEIVSGTNQPGAASGNFIGWYGYFQKYLCENNQTDFCKKPDTFTDPVEKTKCKNHQRSDCMDPNSFIIPQPVPGYGILSSARRGKKVRLKIGVTDGALPLWMVGGDSVKAQGAKEIALGMGPHGNGIYDSLPGATLCAFKTEQQKISKEPDCNPVTNTSTAVSYPLYPAKEDNSQPVWWNPVFQEKYKNMLKKVAIKVESDPELLKAIDFVEATVGNFGEMILYGKDETGWAFCTNDTNPSGHPECECTQQAHDQGKCPDNAISTKNYFCTYNYRSDPKNTPAGVLLWLKAGYTNKKYYDAVMSILTAFEENFLKIPTAISKGSGLYPGDPYIYRNNCTTIATDDTDHYPYRMNTWVIPDALERWGARIYLKFAGFPEGEVTTFKDNCPSKTKCIYETFGSMGAWDLEGTTYPFKKAGETDNDAKNRFWRAIYKANQAHASALMMWTGDFRLMGSYPYLEAALIDAANFIGPQLTLNNTDSKGVTLSSSSIQAGSSLGIKTSWSNVSYVSLWKTKRVTNAGTQRGQTFTTTKDLIVSNPIYLDLVDGSNRVVFKTTYIPTNGTQNWILANGPAGIFESNDQVFIPWSVPSGTYTIRLGLPLDDALTKFWRFNSLPSTSIDGVYSTGKTVTITASTTSRVSFKPGWNFIRWPSGVQLANNQYSEILSSCPIFYRLDNKKGFVKNYSQGSPSFSSGDKLFFKCSSSLW